MVRSSKVRHHIRRNVVGYLALFAALTITPAWAATIGSSDIERNAVRAKHIKKNHVRSKHIRRDNVRRSDIKASAVDSAKVADGSLTAADIDPTQIQRRVSVSCSAGEAVAAVSQAGGIECVSTGGPPTGPAAGDLTGTYPNPIISPEALAVEFREVGVPGEPEFGGAFCEWSNVDPGHNSAGFARDRAGFVHLKGLVRVIAPHIQCEIDFGASETEAIFVLPEGYRPDRRNVFASLANGDLGRVNVAPSGAVLVDEPTAFADANQWASLDGLAFRCAPSGENGCP